MNDERDPTTNPGAPVPESPTPPKPQEPPAPEENAVPQESSAPPEAQQTPAPPTPPKPPAPPVSNPSAITAPTTPHHGFEPGPHPDDRPHRKSPVAAALLNLIPFGLGHLYVGQYTRAAMFFGAIWVSGLVLEQWLLFVFFYFLAVFDAFRQAQLANFAEEGGQSASPGYRGALSFGVFLIVVGAVMLLHNWYDFYVIRRFLQDWWPALLIAAGGWFVVAAIRDRMTGEAPEDDLD